MADIKKTIGANLKRKLAERNISLEKFAYENDISKGYIYDVAKGKANISIEMLDKIAKGLKIKIRDLLD